MTVSLEPGRLDEIELKQREFATCAVTSLRAFADKDVMVAGTLRTLFVIEWTGTHFCLINIVEDLHSGKVLGLQRHAVWSRYS
jgi:hypothetical protein